MSACIDDNPARFPCSGRFRPAPYVTAGCKVLLDDVAPAA
jgi:hypothetical protein